jgi:hypothetical protein
MPDSVEMPAPVNTTARFERSISLLRSSNMARDWHDKAGHEKVSLDGTACLA